MSTEIQPRVPGARSLLDWLGRPAARYAHLLRPPDTTLAERRHHLEASTYYLDEIFLPVFDEVEIRRRAVEEVRVLCALGISVVLTLHWNGHRFRLLRSLVPDGRFGTSTAMEAQLKRHVPLGQLARKAADGFNERRNFHQQHQLQNHVLLTGQLTESPAQRLDRLVGPAPGGEPASGFHLDAVLEGLSLLSEPFSLTIIAEPLPPDFLAGALDFLLAGASICATGAEVTLTQSHAETESSGRSEQDPRYRIHRQAAGIVQGALTLSAAALTLAGGVAATPLLIAAGVGGASHLDLADLFGWRAEVQVSQALTESRAEARRVVDEKMGFHARKLRELAELFEDGGQHGLWAWCGVVSARSLSVAQGVAGVLAGRLSLLGNSLEPIHLRAVRTTERESVEAALDHGLIPRMVEPAGLLGPCYGGLAQTQTLPYLLAGPARGHAGIRVIRHHPVSWTQDEAGPALVLGERPDGATAVHLSLRDLCGHLLICGRTGSGKTLLLRRMLRQLGQMNPRVPFVFLDLAQSVNPRHWAFTPNAAFYEAGRDDLAPSVPPLGLLDFGAPAEYDHYLWQLSDLLANWLPSEGPLPLLLHELLERSFHSRLSAEGHYFLRGEPDIPSILEVEKYIDEVLAAEGGRYEGELRSNLRGALITRLRRLQSVSLLERISGTSAEWFRSLNRGQDLILSLARSGSTGERCFLALAVLIKVRQWLRETRETVTHDRPRLVVAVDEAHILLRKMPERDRGSQSNIHAHAVRWFDELMAEIRQLGAAIIVLDQSPSLLADSVLFSTSSKVVFPLSSGTDMSAVAASLPIAEERRDSLGTLPAGMAYLRSASSSDLVLLRIASPENSELGEERE